MVEVLTGWTFWCGVGSGIALTHLLLLGIRCLRIMLLPYRAKTLAKQTPEDTLERWGLSTDESDEGAVHIIKTHRSKLLYTPHPDPDWLKPVFDEIREMVPAIAKHYYPDYEEPLLAPRITEILRALSLASEEIYMTLRKNWATRILDLRASTLKRSSEFVPVVKKASKIYGILKWIYRAAKYSSPSTYVTLIAKNVAVRYVHGMLIDVVGGRAIALYSGRLKNLDESSL